MNLIATLWHLQVLDQDIDDKTKRLRQIDEALANDPALASARAEFESEQKKFAELRGNLLNTELEAKSIDANLIEINERLYSGRVTNPKELDGLSKDLEMHRRQRSGLDDKLLELMELIDQAQARVNAKSTTLKQIEANRANDLAHLTAEQKSLMPLLSELHANQAQTRESLGADTLRMYDHLRRTKAGRAIAQLRRDSCGACGVTVPTGLVNRVHNGEEIVNCSSCGRILAP
jgi:predicted  nucleic acid-binding Zn-ribbon protein